MVKTLWFNKFWGYLIFLNYVSLHAEPAPVEEVAAPVPDAPVEEVSSSSAPAPVEEEGPSDEWALNSVFD